MEYTTLSPLMSWKNEIDKVDDNLREQLRLVIDFSDGIQMEFGLEKCAKATFKKGKPEKRENIELGNTTTIRALEYHDVYTYLGLEEDYGIQ